GVRWRAGLHRASCKVFRLQPGVQARRRVAPVRSAAVTALQDNRPPRGRVGAIVEGAALAAVPAALCACAAFGVEQAALLSFATVAVSLLVFFAGFERRAP